MGISPVGEASEAMSRKVELSKEAARSQRLSLLETVLPWMRGSWLCRERCMRRSNSRTGVAALSRRGWSNPNLRAKHSPLITDSVALIPIRLESNRAASLRLSQLTNHLNKLKFHLMMSLTSTLVKLKLLSINPLGRVSLILDRTSQARQQEPTWKKTKAGLNLRLTFSTTWTLEHHFSSKSNLRPLQRIKPSKNLTTSV